MLVNPRQILILRDELKLLLQGQDVFSFVQQLSGQIAREVPGRQTLRFELNGEAYYRKLHTGVGWSEIIKNLVRGRLPVVGARNEWLALNLLAEIGVSSLIPVAYGERGVNPARRLSFSVTRELTGTIQLDDYLRANPNLDFLRKRRLVSAVSCIVRTIHAHGLNHRDLYLCHFMLDPMALESTDTRPLLYLIDLHRAQLRKRVPRRWLIKDLASIYFSVMGLGVTRQDIGRFLEVYFDMPLAQLLRQKHKLLRAIAQRAQRFYQREQRLAARGQRQ